MCLSLESHLKCPPLGYSALPCVLHCAYHHHHHNNDDDDSTSSSTSWCRDQPSQTAPSTSIALSCLCIPSSCQLATNFLLPVYRSLKKMYCAELLKWALSSKRVKVIPALFCSQCSMCLSPLSTKKTTTRTTLLIINISHLCYCWWLYMLYFVLYFTFA